MHRNYFFFIVIGAVFCLFLIFFSLWREIDSPVTKELPIIPPRAPYHSYISGVGIVEASSDNIFISSPIQRIVDKVVVKVGDKVKKGDLLFQLEDSDLNANLKEQYLAHQIALAKLKRLESLPRQEDVSTATASLDAAKAEFELAKFQYERVIGLPDPRAISEEEKNRRHSQYQQAEAKWKQAQDHLDKIKEGTWKPDLEIARLEVQETAARIKRFQAELQRTMIKSPIDGVVLQVKIHQGELASPDTFKSPLMIIGDTDQLYLRVDINQLDIPDFQMNSPAVAFRQGDSRFQFPLELVRIEPYLVYKQNLTNEITEKVDTRILQAIYLIKSEDQKLFVGEQMDAFIQSSHNQ